MYRDPLTGPIASGTCDVSIRFLLQMTKEGRVPKIYPPPGRRRYSVSMRILSYGGFLKR